MKIYHVNNVHGKTNHLLHPLLIISKFNLLGSFS